MIESIGIYHIGIPVDDIDRAENFYTKILGMKVADRIGESGARRLTRLKCGDADVVLFQRPRPLKRNTLQEDGIAHQAFEVTPATFDEAVAFLKSQGCYHAGPVVRPSGRAVYFFDSEGNYQQLHASG
jgi:catechol 2,3-dioxygenase-like lactoylglutathione lyase family enzyme